MVVSPIPTVYTVTLNPTEREQLLIVCEYGVATRRGEHPRTLAAQLADLDAD